MRLYESHLLRPLKPSRGSMNVAVAVLLGTMACSFGRAQGLPQSAPSATLAEAMTAACRQSEEQFAQYLTAENAATFRDLSADQRTALMKRMVLLDRPGRPLLSSDAQGHTVLRCETPEITAELRLGETRARDNLAFIRVEVRAPGETCESGGSARRVEFGMVREGGGWKLLSVGLLLLNLAELSRQWAASEMEAKETEAIAALHKLAESIGTYRRAFGRLPETLVQLGPAPKEGISPDAAGLVDEELAAGKKGGYLFRYRILPGTGEGAELGFELAATPAEYGKTGRRSFFLDSSGTLRGGDKQGAVATAADPRIEPR